MAVKRRGGLGKGLDSLIRNKPTVSRGEETTASSEKTKKSGEEDASVSKSKKENKEIKSSLSGLEKEEKISENSTIEVVNGIDNDSNGIIGETGNSKGEAEEKIADTVKDINQPTDSSDKGESVLIMKISAVEPNRDQPRKSFREEGIEELASSIAQYGIIQPLLVQKRDDYYEIIAGERRWRAAMKAGLKEVPVIVKDYTSREAVEISLIENIQREDLNPIEEALAYDRLIQEFSMTQEQVAGRVSKSRSAVTNSLRLLKLEGDVRQMVISGELSEGHARTLLGIPNDETQRLLAERIVKDKLSVRDTEKLVKKLTSNVPKKVRARDYQKEAILNNLSEQLKIILGTKVSITEKGKNKGKIEIEFYSDDELNRIFEMLQSLR